MASLLARKGGRLVQAIDVLIVDDNQFMRKVVRNLLTNVGVRTVYEASDGVAGLEAIRTFVPDIVILDWEMPLLDGGEVARIINNTQRTGAGSSFVVDDGGAKITLEFKPG